MANPPLGSEGGAGAGGGGVGRGTCSVTVQSATATNESTSLQSITVIVSSPTNAPSSAWDDKQLINLPNARKSETQAGGEDCL